MVIPERGGARPPEPRVCVGMSGFACLLSRSGDDVQGEDIEGMLPALRARGPDGVARWRGHAIAAVASLLDPGDARLAASIAWTDDRFLVVGQVRVDERDDLLRRLRHCGRPVDPRMADIELVAHGWAALGLSLLHVMLGDFSFVVHDTRARTTVLVRDPFGVRLLYYALSPGYLAVSNTLASVLSAPAVTRALNSDAIADFIASGLNEDLATTTFRDVHRVPPAHYACIDGGATARLVQYWRLPEPAETRRASPADYVQGFRAVLDASVADRLRSPSVAVLMSGGVDSTSLAAITRRMRPAPFPITAVTISSPAAPDGDMIRAERAATSLGLQQWVIDSESIPSMAAACSAVVATPEPFDEPDLAVWRALLSAAGRASRVALFGEDPDTILSPPDWPELLRVVSPLRLAIDVLQYRWRMGRRPHLGVRDRARRLLLRQPGRTSSDRLESPPWMAPGLRRRRAERLSAAKAPQHSTRPDMARHLAHPLWQSMLEALDAGVLGLPIDVRLPYMDRRVIEFSLSVPAIPWLQRKHLLREAMCGDLPDSVRLAPKRSARGLTEHRMAGWWASDPAPFEPSEALARFVDVRALPPVTPSSLPDTMLAHLRLRLLDHWLRQTPHLL